MGQFLYIYFFCIKSSSFVEAGRGDGTRSVARRIGWDGVLSLDWVGQALVRRLGEDRASTTANLRQIGCPGSGRGSFNDRITLRGWTG